MRDSVISQQNHQEATVSVITANDNHFTTETEMKFSPIKIKEEAEQQQEQEQDQDQIEDGSTQDCYPDKIPKETETITQLNVMPLNENRQTLNQPMLAEIPRTSLKKHMPGFLNTTKASKSKENGSNHYKFSANSLKKRSPMKKNVNDRLSCLPFTYYTPQAQSAFLNTPKASQDINCEQAVAAFPVIGGYLIDPQNPKH